MGRLLRTDRLRQVHPELALFALQWAEEHLGTWMVVTGERCLADVLAKYAVGRTTPGPHAGEQGHPTLGETVTNVSTLEKAPHAARVTPSGLYACAVDLQFFTGRGLELAAGETAEQRTVYLEMGEAAEKAGLVWGGRFKRLFDQAHVELLDWRRYPLPAPGTV